MRRDSQTVVEGGLSGGFLAGFTLNLGLGIQSSQGRYRWVVANAGSVRAKAGGWVRLGKRHTIGEAAGSGVERQGTHLGLSGITLGLGFESEDNEHTQAFY